MTKGFITRLEEGVAKKAGERRRVKILAREERAQGAWMGGSILASLSTFEDQCLSRAEYEEAGPQIVHKKFY